MIAMKKFDVTINANTKRGLALLLSAHDKRSYNLVHLVRTFNLTAAILDLLEKSKKPLRCKEIASALHGQGMPCSVAGVSTALQSLKRGGFVGMEVYYDEYDLIDVGDYCKKAYVTRYYFIKKA